MSAGTAQLVRHCRAGWMSVTQLFSKEAYGAFVGIAHIGWIRSHFEHSPMSARVSRMRADNALYRAVKLAGTGELSRHDYSRTKPPIGRIRDVSRSLDA